MKTYFVFHSFVHINYSSYMNEVLIYNTENNYSLLSSNENLIGSIKKMNKPEVSYFIELANNYYLCKDFIQIITSLEDNMCGELITCEREAMPIQLSSHIRMQNDLLFEKNYFNHNKENEFINKIYLDEIGNDILLEVLEISIFYGNLKDEYKYANAHQQYMFPLAEDGQILYDMNAIFKFNLPRLHTVNFIIGQLTDDEFETLYRYINENMSSKVVNLYTTHNIYKKLASDFLCLFNTTYIWTDLRKDMEETYPNNHKILYLSENISSLIEMEHYFDSKYLFPLYNGKNSSSIQEYLGFSRKDLLNVNSTEHDILVNTYINSNFFGELTIYPNGNVHSCKNSPPIGNLRMNNIKEVVLEELYKQQSWFIVRKRLSLCADCVFNRLCPPISNLEMSINLTNLCKRYEE